MRKSFIVLLRADLIFTHFLEFRASAEQDQPLDGWATILVGAPKVSRTPYGIHYLRGDVPCLYNVLHQKGTQFMGRDMRYEVHQFGLISLISTLAGHLVLIWGYKMDETS